MGKLRHILAEGRHLRDVVLDDQLARKHLPAAELRALFDPANYLGMSREFTRRALAGWRANGGPRRSGRS